MGDTRGISRLGLLVAGGGAKVRRLVAGCSSMDELEAVLPVPLMKAARRAEEGPVSRLLERVTRAGWCWLEADGPEYPAILNHTADPPLGLFIKGRLGAGPSIAIVGSRRATTYGLHAAKYLAESVGRAGGTIISGMARGVDAAAHEGALSVGAPTWAVWGCGPDTIYPPEHLRLAEQIAENGALITEYLPGASPRRHHFPERNRIVAGLASIVVVVEAAARSGALSTARQALDEGREVMAVPGSIFSEVSVGPNGLLRAGALPVTCAGDVLEALGLDQVSAAHGKADPDDLPLETGETLAIEEVAQRMGGTMAEVQAEIVKLEIEGLIERGVDGLIRRRG